MNILVTGATGFVGKNLVPELKKTNEVHLLVRPKSKYETISCDGVFVFDDNITDLSDYLRENKIDGIIHLASLYIAQHEGSQIKDLVLSNIYLGTAILEALKGTQVRWFLNTGTIWQNYNAADYSRAYNPVNLYAATKQAFIDMAKFYTETMDIRFCTLKLCDTYGPNDTRRKIMALFADMAKNRTHLDMSAGEQLMDIVHIDDVVTAFITLADLLNGKEAIEDEYVVSSGKQISLKQLAAMFEKANNVTLNITWGARPYRLREVMKPYRGEVVPGWQPMRDLNKPANKFGGGSRPLLITSPDLSKERRAA